MGRTFREIAETVITAAVIFVLLQAATQTFKVVGPSMNTTLADGQHLLVNKFVYETVDSDVLADVLPWVGPDADGELEYLFHPPERGDIIVFRPPTGEDADFVKRVIGIPGDEIDIHDGSVWVNGEKLKEDRVTRPRGSTDFPTIVPADRYFVLGDNRSASNDSRAWGFAEADKIVGKVMARYWPPSEFTLF
ncbi:MAG: signal peptidase I [Chloroflexi bacterium]|nr:signal peptidase I [Chloroflexota bacterium]